MQLQIFKLSKKLVATINHLYEQFSKNQSHMPEIILTRDIKSLHLLHCLAKLKNYFLINLSIEFPQISK